MIYQKEKRIALGGNKSDMYEEETVTEEEAKEFANRMELYSN